MKKTLTKENFLSISIGKQPAQEFEPSSSYRMQMNFFVI